MATDPETPPRTARPSTDFRPPEPAAGPAIWCSDCRATIRGHYYALNERPVCGKCREPYRQRIARGTGAGAMRRAILWGLGASLGGALAFSLVVSFIGFGRIPMAIGVGYMVGKAISASNGDYPGRRYQLLAAFLTYFAIGLGNVAPAVRQVMSMSDSERQAAIAREDAAEHPLDDVQAAAGVDATPEETAMEAELGRELTPREARARADSLASERRRNAGFFTALGALTVMLVTLPLISGLAYGIYGELITLIAIGYGIYQAWHATAGGPELSISGPFRVGTGPITHTI